MSVEPGSDWKGSLTAIARYENIQRIQRAIDAGSKDAQQRSAFEIENNAYANATSLAEYERRCQLPASPSPKTVHEATQQREQPPEDNDAHTDTASPGTRIGPYDNCRYIASGVTAQVYRCNTRALKVIVETHSIAPHDPVREARILRELQRPCIPLLETFRDQEQRLVLVFPYMPQTLESLLSRGGLTSAQVRSLFRDLFLALRDIHARGIIHRDVKPSAILLESPDGPAYLSDFGSAWHPRLSASTEPAHAKILDIGTGPYRAPEVLFGDSAYGPAVDMWGAGALLAECCRRPPSPLFESRPAHEDGSQLGLILSIFKTIGSPTRETWSEAAQFRTPPFEMYRFFEGKPWHEVLRGVEPGFVELIKALVRYNSSRATAAQALAYECLA